MSQPCDSCPSPCHWDRIPVCTAVVNGIKTLLFFLFWTLIGSIGMVLAVNGKGSWLLVVSFLAYLGMFVKWGCLDAGH